MINTHIKQFTEKKSQIFIWIQQVLCRNALFFFKCSERSLIGYGYAKMFRIWFRSQKNNIDSPLLGRLTFGLGCCLYKSVIRDLCSKQISKNRQIKWYEIQRYAFPGKLVIIWWNIWFLWCLNFFVIVFFWLILRQFVLAVGWISK